MSSLETYNKKKRICSLADTYIFLDEIGSRNKSKIVTLKQNERLGQTSK